MTKKDRRIASVLALTVVFLNLFSACFVITEAVHDCIGEDCPICCQISICENTLRSAGVVAEAVIFTGFLALLSVVMPALTKKRAGHGSLVSLKVKLSD